MSDSVRDPAIDWAACAGHLAHLTLDLQRCNSLLDDVKCTDCPDLEQFLTNVDDLSQSTSVKMREFKCLTWLE